MNRKKIDPLTYVLEPITHIWTLGKIKKIRHKISNSIPLGSKILEIGCGEGNLSKIIAKNAKYTLSIDLSPQMIKKAKKNKRFLKPEVTEKLDFKAVNIFKFNQLDNFDVILSKMCLCELTPQQLEKLLKKIKSSNFKGKIILFEEHLPHKHLIGKLFFYSRYLTRPLFHFLAKSPLQPIHNYEEVFSKYGLNLSDKRIFFYGHRAIYTFEK